MAKKPAEKDNALAEVIAGGGYTKPAAEPSPTVTIKPPNMQRIEVAIRGNAPLMINRFSQKALMQMQEKQAAGSQAAKGKKREAKDFDEAFVGARHISRQGWDGIAAGAFRNALISACRLVGFKMTLAKLSLFVEADGFDQHDGTPLIRILSADLKEADMPIKSVMAARNATGVIDLRTRPRWDEWGAILRIRFDADQFSPLDVVNLLARVGLQCGIGEGRPDSKMSAGIGFGTFDLVQDQDEAEVQTAA
jgi:hypothetical protein